MKLSMKIRSRKEWERVRARGHRHWILWRGLLGFALPFLIVMLGYLYVIELFFPSESTRPWWAVVLVGVMLAAGAGYAVADRVWHRAEDRFYNRDSHLETPSVG